MSTGSEQQVYDDDVREERYEAVRDRMVQLQAELEDLCFKIAQLERAGDVRLELVQLAIEVVALDKHIDAMLRRTVTGP